MCYWYEIGTFGGLGDYSCHQMQGTRGIRQGGGYIMTPTDGTPRWVSDTMIQNSIQGAREAALERLEKMKDTFNWSINRLIADLKG